MRGLRGAGRGDAAFAFSLSMHNAVTAAVPAPARGAARDVGASGCRRRRAGRLLADRAAGRIRCRGDHDARRAGREGWRVTGRKAWVSLAGEADLFLVVCHTGAGAGHRDIAIMAVERAARPASRSRASTTRRARRSCRSARCCSRTHPRTNWSPRPGRACVPRWRDRRRPLRHRCDRGRPARRVARRGAALRPRSAGVRRTRARLPGASAGCWPTSPPNSWRHACWFRQPPRRAGHARRARWRWPTPSGSAPTPPCARRSPAARCSAPTAG